MSRATLLREPEEYVEFRDSVRRWYARNDPGDLRQQYADAPGSVGSRNARLAVLRAQAEQGWLDPDLDSHARCVLAEEGGYALNVSPWLSTTAAIATLPAGDPAAAAASAGAVAIAIADGLTESAGETITAVLREVTDAGDASVLIVGLPGGKVGVVELTGTEATPRDALDPLRTRAEVRLDAAPVRIVRARTSTTSATMLLAAESLGVASRALDLAVDHAINRVQFGASVGSKQAISHPLADGYGELEFARALVYRAAALLDAGAEDDRACLAVHAGAETATAAASRISEIGLQVMGGSGMTWEVPLHWFLKRAWSNRARVGGHHVREQIATRLFDGTGSVSLTD